LYRLNWNITAGLSVSWRCHLHCCCRSRRRGANPS